MKDILVKELVKSAKRFFSKPRNIEEYKKWHLEKQKKGDRGSYEKER